MVFMMEFSRKNPQQTKRNMFEYISSVVLCILREACVSRGAAGQDGVIPLLYLPPPEVFFLCSSWREAQSGLSVRIHSHSTTLPPLCRTTINHRLNKTKPSLFHNTVNRSEPRHLWYDVSHLLYYSFPTVCVKHHFEICSSFIFMLLFYLPFNQLAFEWTFLNNTNLIHWIQIHNEICSILHFNNVFNLGFDNSQWLIFKKM